MVTAPDPANPASARTVRPRPAAPAATILAVGAQTDAAPAARTSSSTPNDQ